MRLVLIGVVVVVVTFIGTVHEAQQHRASLSSAGCKPLQGVVSVRVSPGTVGYARRQGWPRVLVKGGEPTGDVLSYDHGPVAKRVRAAVEELCARDRFVLVAGRP